MLNFDEKIDIAGTHKYNSDKMLEALATHFYEICYLCDIHTPVNFETEHFKPKSKFPSLKNEVENLFYSCNRCNQIKSNTYNSDAATEILNSKIDDVENIIKLKLREEKSTIPNEIEITIDHEKVSSELVAKSEKTKELLNKIYNGINTKSKIKAGKLRKEIKNEIAIFENLLEGYDKTKLKKSYSLQIKKYISKKQKLKNFSNFVSFKRQVVKDKDKYKKIFLPFFD